MSDLCNAGERSSRNSASNAWDDTRRTRCRAHWERMLGQRERPRWTNFSWISPATLLDSVNDQLAKGIRDLVDARRMRWVNGRREVRAVAGASAAGFEWRLQAPPGVDDRFAFAILGDPGEQDASQYAVVCPLLSKAGELDCRFMVMLSDVIYPAGDVNDYIDGFYRPYERFPGPIYAIPGNHDWYDGLEGFMFHFCGAESLAAPTYRGGSYGFRERVAHGLWRRSSRPHRADLYRWWQRRAAQVNAPLQPGPYWAMDTGSLMLVGIDTGVTGDLDAEQGDWLLNVARSEPEKPKVLLTGKPIYVDGRYHPGKIRWGEGTPSELTGRPQTVDDIVRAKEHRFVAVIGGDVHNYQHYRVKIRDVPAGCEAPPSGALERHVHYLVSGGGGAYLSATHRFGAVEMTSALPAGVGPVGEAEFCCYPLRGDSLAQFTRNFGRWLGVVWVITWTLLIALVLGWLLELREHRVRDVDLGAVPLSLLAVSAPSVLAATVLALYGGHRLVAKLPPELRWIAQVGVTVALGASEVLLAHWIFDEPWNWLWKMATVTAAIVVGPLLLIVLAYVARNHLPRRLGPFLLAAGAFAFGVARLRPDSLVEIGLTVVVGAVLLAIVAMGLRVLADAAKRWYPRVVASVCAALVVLAFAVFWEQWPAPAAVAALAGLLLALWLLLLVFTWPVALGFPLFIKARMDPDKACALVAEKRGFPRERGTADPDRATRWLGHLLLGFPGSVINRFVSEAAEANAPPFFKSFLTVSVGSDLRIDCWGVSGYSTAETEPTLEDSITIPLPASTPVPQVHR